MARALQTLIVARDENIGRDLKGIFMRSDDRVEVVADGQSALLKLDTFSPDVVFLDVELPDMPGAALLKEIKAADPSIYAIAIGSREKASLLQEALAAGADQSVEKPFNPDTLRKEVLEKLPRERVVSHRDATRALGIEHERLELLFGQIKEGVVILDKQGRVLVGNRVARAVLRMPETVRGTPLEKGKTQGRTSILR